MHRRPLAAAALTMTRRAVVASMIRGRVAPWLQALALLVPALSRPGRAQERPAGAYALQPVVTERLYQRLRFEADGTGRRDLHVRARVQTEAGVQGLGEISYGYNSAEETPTIDPVLVHKTGGGIAAAGPAALQDATPPAPRPAPVHSNLAVPTDDERRRRTAAEAWKPKVHSVQVSTFRSWEDVGRWYGTLARDRESVSPEVQSKAQALVRDRRTRRDTLEALYDFVSKNYRYVSLSFGVGRYQPHAPGQLPSPTGMRADARGQRPGSGTLKVAVGRVVRGDAGVTRRLGFRATPPAQWNALATAMATAEGLYGEVTDVQPDDPTATRDPFQFTFQLTKSGYLEWSGKRAHVSGPLPTIDFPADTSDTAGPHTSVSDQEYATRLKLALPAGVTARAPVPVELMRPYGKYRSSYVVRGDTITIERTLHFTGQILSRADQRRSEEHTSEL